MEGALVTALLPQCYQLNSVYPCARAAVVRVCVCVESSKPSVLFPVADEIFTSSKRTVLCTLFELVVFV